MYTSRLERNTVYLLEIAETLDALEVRLDEISPKLDQIFDYLMTRFTCMMGVYPGGSGCGSNPTS